MPPFASAGFGMNVLTTAGPQHLEVTDPYERSTIAHHWNAVDRYLAGDPRPLRDLHLRLTYSPFGTSIAGKQLLFDEREIDWFAARGETDGFELYEDDAS